MDQHAWVEGFPGAITVCDPEGIILEMNDAAIRVFQKDGGRDLLGRNLLDCHHEEARRRLQELMAQRQINVYTIEKHGVKKLIYQSPWFQDGEYAGFMELSLELPAELPHFLRN